MLDLRNDPGGLLTSAIGVAGAFLPPDALVVSTDGRTPDSRHKYLATPSEYARGEGNYLSGIPGWTKTVPMVVLVNVGSASASEIVAGALQDHKRAKVLGNRTFGKGSVQVILPLSETTAVKLTTSRYSRPAAAPSRPPASSLTTSWPTRPMATCSACRARPTCSAICPTSKARTPK